MMLKQKVAGESNRCSRCGRTIEESDHVYLRVETDGEVHSVPWTCVFCGSAHNEGYAKAQAVGVFEARGMIDEIVELRKQINSLEGLLNCRTGIDAYDKGYDQGRSDASPLPKEGIVFSDVEQYKAFLRSCESTPIRRAEARLAVESDMCSKCGRGIPKGSSPYFSPHPNNGLWCDDCGNLYKTFAAVGKQRLDRESEGGTAQNRMWNRWHYLIELRNKGNLTKPSEQMEYNALNTLVEHLDMVDETETLKGRIDHLERLVGCDQRLWDAAKAAMQAIVAHQQNSTCEITSREELASRACEISEALVVEFDNRVRG